MQVGVQVHTLVGNSRTNDSRTVLQPQWTHLPWVACLYRTVRVLLGVLCFVSVPIKLSKAQHIGWLWNFVWPVFLWGWPECVVSSILTDHLDLVDVSQCCLSYTRVNSSKACIIWICSAAIFTRSLAYESTPSNVNDELIDQLIDRLVS